MSDNVTEIVQEAQSKKKFNLVDAVKGRAYPEKTVDVYLDAAAGLELKDIDSKLQGLANGGKTDEELEKKAKELSEKILSSKLTFHMRGVGQATVEKITNKTNELYPKSDLGDEEWLKHYICALVASNIVMVTDAEGNEDISEFTVEDVMEIRGSIPIDSWEVLVDTMQKLTLASSYFDAVTDAGFLPKS